MIKVPESGIYVSVLTDRTIPCFVKGEATCLLFNARNYRGKKVDVLCRNVSVYLLWLGSTWFWSCMSLLKTKVFLKIWCHILQRSAKVLPRAPGVCLHRSIHTSSQVQRSQIGQRGARWQFRLLERVLFNKNEQVPSLGIALPEGHAHIAWSNFQTLLLWLYTYQ